MTKESLKELILTLEKIQSVLIQEGEQEWVYGISSIKRRLTDINIDSPDFKKEFKSVQLSYLNMTNGAGSFSDVMIWRSNVEDRIKVNKDFNALTKKTWELFEL